MHRRFYSGILERRCRVEHCKNDGRDAHWPREWPPFRLKPSAAPQLDAGEFIPRLGFPRDPPQHRFHMFLDGILAGYRGFRVRLRHPTLLVLLGTRRQVWATIAHPDNFFCDQSHTIPRMRLIANRPRSCRSEPAGEAFEADHCEPIRHLQGLEHRAQKWEPVLREKML